MKSTNLFDVGCVVCGRRLRIAQHGICSCCYQQVIRQPYCGRCGAVLPENRLQCGLCLLAPPKWQRIVFVSAFEEPIRSLIYRFKFNQDYWLDRSLARWLLLAVREAKRTHNLSLPDLLIPVPLHHQRQWRRGYNQASLLARYLSHWLNIPFRQDLIQRQRATESQRGKSAEQRQKNLAQAFKLVKPLPVGIKSIALIDDVITTGTTMEEICHCLQQVGVQEIQVWALCKTQKMS
ncbi:phosphoribosyltransferase family protein [Gallibacterium salpingitidis]|uniref:Competence protein ComF n=1 Tax=Gallibacterium salpingitidis TaxID=505341 RepID=A0A1A7P204_9PAST|nr:phosphoribosyltransferase family protein [Gallibacterium salpingitidis]OBW96472.1 competence protein ComF [Gallibacterium salpingitidis]WKS99370.1 phosphoribosyltransferase family protein [Gallibacterium salpingitidis]